MHCQTLILTKNVKPIASSSFSGEQSVASIVTTITIFFTFYCYSGSFGLILKGTICYVIFIEKYEQTYIDFRIVYLRDLSMR